MRTLHLHGIEHATRLVAIILTLATLPFVSRASRPFVTEDAGVAGKGIVQFEMSWDYLKWRNIDRENVFTIVPIFGLSDGVELSFEAPFVSHYHSDGNRHAGIGDVNVVTKFLVSNESDLTPAFALKTAVKTTTARNETDFGSGAVDYSIVAVASKQVGDFTLHGMFGYTFIGKNGGDNLRDVVCCGLAADYSMTEHVHLVGEVVGNTNADRTTTQHPISAMIGTTFTLSDEFVIDTSTRFGLTSAMPDWNTSVGVTVSL